MAPSTKRFLALAAEAVARNVARKAALQHHKTAAAVVPWTGLGESDMVGCIGEYFEGCGYWIWREDAYEAPKNAKMDFWAKNPLLTFGPSGWCIEAKVLWDGRHAKSRDNRLNRKRFKKNGEILKDFRYLSQCERSGAAKAVFWIVLSDSPSLEVSESRARLGVPDARAQVEKSHPAWSVVGEARADVDEVVEIAAFRFVHVLVWNG
jgi:hypothetical protein